MNLISERKVSNRTEKMASTGSCAASMIYRLRGDHDHDCGGDLSEILCIDRGETVRFERISRPNSRPQRNIGQEVQEF
jgi:hypothetical protein